MNKHQSAIEHAQSALILLQEELFQQPHRAQEGSGSKTLKMTSLNLNTIDVHVQDPQNINKDRVSVLCIGYHNLAVEHEYLKQYQSCVSAYQKVCAYYAFLSSKVKKGVIRPVEITTRRFILKSVPIIFIQMLQKRTLRINVCVLCVVFSTPHKMYRDLT